MTLNFAIKALIIFIFNCSSCTTKCGREIGNLLHIEPKKYVCNYNETH